MKIIQDKVALITGGSSGIGLAIAQILAARGAHIWLLARNEGKLNTAIDKVIACRANVSQRFGIIIADVTDYEVVDRELLRLHDEIGLPDLVVNSAGAAHPGYVQELDLKVFHWMMDVNYFGTVNVTKSLLPGMIERGSGHFVNISSLAGLLGVFGYSAYGASKYALRGFSDVLRAEVKPYGIDVSIVFPPDTETPQLIYENQFKPLETKALGSSAGAMSAIEVANAVVQGIIRNRYMILPGIESKLLYNFSGLFGKLIYPIMDLLIARVRKGK